MYQRHNLVGFLLVILVTVGLLIVVSLLQRLNGARIPARAPMVLGWVVLLEVGLLLAVRAWDSSELQEELRHVASAPGSRVVLSGGGVTVTLTNQSGAAELLADLQTVKSVMAHHSGTTRFWDISFQSRNGNFRYRLAQDSQRAYEFWVYRAGPQGFNDELEIGRVQSEHLESLMDSVLKP